MILVRFQHAGDGNPPAATLVALCVNITPFLFPIIQRRHGDFGVFRVGMMHRLGIVPRACWATLRVFQSTSSATRQAASVCDAPYATAVRKSPPRDLHIGRDWTVNRAPGEGAISRFLLAVACRRVAVGRVASRRARARKAWRGAISLALQAFAKSFSTMYL